MKNRISGIIILLIVAISALFGQTKQPITVLVNPNMQPLQTYSHLRGVRGFSIDLLESVLHRSNLNCEYITQSNLNTNKRIQIIPDTPGFLTNSGYYHLSDPYITVTLSYIIRKNSLHNTSQSLRNQHIAVIDESIEHTFISCFHFTEDVTTVKSIEEGILLVKEGLCEALLICDKSSSRAININQLNGLMVEEIEGLGQIPLHFAVHQTDSLLLKQINAGIKRIKQEGLYQTIYKKWFGNITPTSLTFWERYSLYIVGSMLIFLLVIVALLYIKTKLTILRSNRLSKQLEIAIEAGKASVWRYEIKQDSFYNVRGETWLSYNETLPSLVFKIKKEDRERFTNALQKIIDNNNETSEAIVQLKSPVDNSNHYIKTNMIGILHNGKLQSIIGTRTDITEGIQKQKQIEQAAKKFAAVFDTTTVGLEYYNRDGVLADINTAALDILGISDKAKLLASGKKLDGDSVYQQVFSNRKQNGRYEIDVNYNLDNVEKDYHQRSTKTGIRNFHLKISILDDTEGFESCSIVAIYDFTENLNLNKEYTRLNKENNTILKTLPVCVATYDRFGVQTYINDAYQNTFGMKSTDQFLQKKVNLFDNPILPDEFKNSIKKGTDELMTQENWCDLSAPEIMNYYDSEGMGMKRLSFIFKCIVDNNNKLEQIIAITSDITQLHETLKELREAKIKAEQSDKLKSAFLANMSHEIRTPLNAIVGFSDLLMDSPDDEDKMEFCKLIRSNNEHLLGLINDILDLSKIESGEIHIMLSEFDLCELFSELETSFAIKIKPGIELKCTIPHNRLIVKMDKKRITQLMNNFLSNAFKYTDKGEINFGYEVVNRGIRFFSTDTGIGISEENKTRVFKRFEKFDTFAQGTGLGLSICKALVTASNGKIGFDSELGKGSTFWAWIPCSIIEEGETIVEKIEKKTEKSNNKTSIDDIKILIAEDNDSNYRLISILLKKCELHRAINGQEAVNMAMNEHFDFIFMDIRMPIMDGIEATKKIRLLDIQTPIIALTANVFDSDREAALNAGCNNFLTKPIKMEEIVQILTPSVQKNHSTQSHS